MKPAIRRFSPALSVALALVALVVRAPRHPEQRAAQEEHAVARREARRVDLDRMDGAARIHQALPARNQRFDRRERAPERTSRSQTPSAPRAREESTLTATSRSSSISCA